MREPPAGFGVDAVAAALRTDWGYDAATVEHLPVGFGAHHWRADRALFVTLDVPGPHHDATSLEDAYASAAALDLDLVVACRPTRAGTYTVPVGPGRLSCTPWLEPTGAEADPEVVVAALARLHSAPAPPRSPRWTPRVGPELADRLGRLTERRWDTGPYGERARVAVADRLVAVAAWTAHYHALAEVAQGRPWVPTHGEPHAANQLLTAAGLRFVDWESFLLAPRERDLGALVAAGVEVAADPEMLAMYDLEWRLDEISQYADWLAAPHTGTADDAIAFEGLQRELRR